MARSPTSPRASVAQQVGGPSRAGRGAGVRRGFRHAVRCAERTAWSRPRPRAECRSGDVGSWTRIDGGWRCGCEVPSTDATQRAAPIVRRAPRAVWSAAESRPVGRTQGGHGTNSVAAVAGCTCAPERTPPPGGTDGRATALPSADADGGSVRASSPQTRTRRGARVDTAGRRAPSRADASGVSLRWRSVPGVCGSAGRHRARASPRRWSSALFHGGPTGRAGGGAGVTTMAGPECPPMSSPGPFSCVQASGRSHPRRARRRRVRCVWSGRRGAGGGVGRRALGLPIPRRGCGPAAVAGPRRVLGEGGEVGRGVAGRRSGWVAEVVLRVTCAARLLGAVARAVVPTARVLRCSRPGVVSVGLE
jgi:hypothetical protein